MIDTLKVEEDDPSLRVIEASRPTLSSQNFLGQTSGDLSDNNFEGAAAQKDLLSPTKREK